MAKQLLKDTTSAVVEQLLQAMMPQLNARLDSLQKQIADLQMRMDQRFEQVQQQFEKIEVKLERQQELINELGLRINSVGAKLDAYVDITRTTHSDVNRFLERLVRVEEAQKNKRRRAS